MKKTNYVKISASSVEVNGELIETISSGSGMLKEIYAQRIGNYPKFHKMDILCQLGFIATELLLLSEAETRFKERDDRAVILFGLNSSYYTDVQYQKTISDKDNYFPSPSLFVYTLPNIVTGEIALRNNYHGETSYIVVENKQQMEWHIDTLIKTSRTFNSMICGWIDAKGKNDFEAELWIVE